MKKLYLLIAAAGILPSVAEAAVQAAVQQQETLAVRQDMALDEFGVGGGGGGGGTSTTTTTTTTTTTPTAQYKYALNNGLQLQVNQKLSLNDSLTLLDETPNAELTLDRTVLVTEFPALKKYDDLSTSTTTPFIEFDSDVTDDSNWHHKFELDDNGLMVEVDEDSLSSLDLSTIENTYKISCKTHPQLCEVKEWDPETEKEYNPFTDRLRFCNLYTSKCFLRLDLVKPFIKNNGFFKPRIINPPAKPILISSFNCLGVTCGEGQVCINGCCRYFRKIATDLDADKLVSLSSSALKKYKLDLTNLKVVALDSAVKDGSAKLVIENDANKVFIQTAKDKMLTATSALQTELNAVK